MSEQAQIPIPNSRIFVAPKRIGDVLDISRSQADAMERAGLFPKKVKLSPGRKAWLMTDLIAWAEERVRESRGTQK